MKQQNKINIPNMITILRIILIAPLLYLLWQGRLIIALFVFFIILISDIADGFFARKLKQESDFGCYLDFAADYAVFFSLLGLFIWLGRVSTINIIITIAAVCVLLLISVILAIKTGKAYMPHRTSGKFGSVIINLAMLLYMLDFYYANHVFFIVLLVLFSYVIPDYIYYSVKFKKKR